MPIPDRAARYGARHRHIRKHLIAQYEAAGRGWACAHCSQPMHDHPRLLDLAHADTGGYRGLAHRRCNRGHDQAETNRRTAHRRDAAGSDPAPQPRTNWD